MQTYNPHNNINNFPPDVLAKIFGFLPEKDRDNARRVCKQWRFTGNQLFIQLGSCIAQLENSPAFKRIPIQPNDIKIKFINNLKQIQRRFFELIKFNQVDNIVNESITRLLRLCDRVLRVSGWHPLENAYYYTCQLIIDDLQITQYVPLFWKRLQQDNPEFYLLLQQLKIIESQIKNINSQQKLVNLYVQKFIELLKFNYKLITKALRFLPSAVNAKQLKLLDIVHQNIMSLGNVNLHFNFLLVIRKVSFSWTIGVLVKYDREEGYQPFHRLNEYRVQHSKRILDMQIKSGGLQKISFTEKQIQTFWQKSFENRLSARIYKWKDKKDNLIGVIKSRTIRDNFKEAVILCGTNHENIINLIGILLDQVKNLYWLFLPYMQQGSLRDVLEQSPGTLKPEQKNEIIRGIISGLKYLHEVGIIHLDIKSANVLVDKGRNVKIIDFDTSIFRGEMIKGRVGTRTHMAPEITRLGRIGKYVPTEKADIYSLGVIFWEMFTGKTSDSLLNSITPNCSNEPYYVNENKNLRKKFLKGFRQCLTQPHATIVPRCLAEHPAGRPSARALLVTFTK